MRIEATLDRVALAVDPSAEWVIKANEARYWSLWAGRLGSPWGQHPTLWATPEPVLHPTLPVLHEPTATLQFGCCMRKLSTLDSFSFLIMEFNEMNVVSRTFFSDLTSIMKDFTPYRILPFGDVLNLTGKRAVYVEIFAYQNILFARGRFEQFLRGTSKIDPFGMKLGV